MHASSSLVAPMGHGAKCIPTTILLGAASIGAGAMFKTRQDGEETVATEPGVDSADQSLY